MQLDLNHDQLSLVDAVERVIGPPTEPQRCVDSFVYDFAVDAGLAEGGFFDLLGNGYSMLDAVLVALVIARLPSTVEATASMLLKPLIPNDYERPIAFMRDAQCTPVRYLPMAKTVLIECESHVRAIKLGAEDVDPVATPFAYPYGRLSEGAIRRADSLNVDFQAFHARSKLSIAVDLVGAMQGAFDRTLQQVKDRKQFGRPIGAFQAVQHRLAAAAQIIAAGRLLICRAAHSGSVSDCAMALAYAQAHSHQLTYDFHQFSGAMGLTLEYPLHLWTYRTRALVGEYGGSGTQASLVSNMTWPMAG